jgi:hypothetical protein
MATGRRTIEETADTAIKGASQVATPKRTAAKTTGRKPQAGKLVSVRIDPVELEKMRETFNENGVSLAGGIKLCAMYGLQEIESGRLRVTKSGLFTRR